MTTPAESAANFKQAILDKLAAGPRDVVSLMTDLQCARKTVDLYLARLEKVRKVHRQMLPVKGRHFAWHIGPALPVVSLPEPDSDLDIEESPLHRPRQIIRTSYPDKVRTRMEFETYLFGPAQREAA